MRTLPILLAAAGLAAAGLALGSCGDNIKPFATDGGGTGDAPTADAQTDAPPIDGSGGSFPPAPTLGPQIDRVGRPWVAQTLIDLGGSNQSTVDNDVDTYDEDGSPGSDGASWQAAYVPTFAMSLALLDAIDTGFPLGSNAEGSAIAGGCGNQVLYNDHVGGGGSATATSYVTLAGILADDELFLDTTTELGGACDIPISHANYLGVELYIAAGEASGPVPHETCGGRAPLNDAMGASYSAFTIGEGGFENPPTAAPFTPIFTDGATAHGDVDDDTFPFLGAPHS